MHQLIGYADAMMAQKRDIARCARYVDRPPAKLGDADSASPLVVLAGAEMAEDPANLERGALLSPILRLPPAWRNTMLEWLGQAEPYRTHPVTARFKILNAGASPISVVVGVQKEAHVDPMTGNANPKAYDQVKRYLELQPNKTTWLAYRWASAALSKLGAETLFPAQMPQTAEPTFPPRRPLLEVAYHVELTHPQSGELLVIDSEEWARERAAATAEAEAAELEATPKKTRKASASAVAATAEE